MKDLSAKKCRAILNIDFKIRMTFNEINYKWSRGRVRKALPQDKEDYVFIPYKNRGSHELFVYESDLTFY